MTAQFQPVGPATVPCKCCDSDAPLYGVVDFHRHCNVSAPDALALSGIPVYYHRCRVCGFLFTTAFDAFTDDDFSRRLYNDDYIRVDPDFADARPAGNAAAIQYLFGGTPGLRLIDYGGGNGRLAAHLRGAGFQSVATYDPFVPAHARRPQERFDCLVSFEVLEHSPHPRETLEEMDSLLAPNGMILFSTLVQGAEFEAQGMNWWYIGPRNGHVSLHSRRSLLHLVEPMGYGFASFNDNLHVLFRQMPDFARHLLPA